MADKTDNIKTRLSFDGEKEYKDNCAQINSNLKLLSSELKVSTTQFARNGESTDALRSKQNILKKTFDEQAAKVKETEKALQSMKDAQGDNSEGSKRMETALNKAKAEMLSTGNQIKDLDDKLQNAGKSSTSFGDKLKSGLSGLGSGLATGAKAAGASLAAMGAATVAAAAGAGKLLMSSVETADGLQQMSDVTGISAEQLQVMKYQGSALGVELDTMTRAQAKLTKNMQSASTGSKTQTAAFKALGVSVTDGNGHLRNSTEVFNEVITKLGGMENSTERDATAMNIFGKSAMELNPLIKAGGDELKNMSDEAKKNGAVMSNEAVSGLDSFGDSLDASKLALKGMAGTMAAGALPMLNQFTGLIGDMSGALNTALTTGDFTQFGTVLSNGISSIVTQLSGLITKAIPIVSQVLSSAIGAIVQAIPAALPALASGVVLIITSVLQILQDNGPALITAGVQAIMTLISGLTSALPQIMSTAITVILTLVNSLSAQLPTLIPMAVQAIMTIVNGLISNLPQIIDSAIKIIMALIQGIMNALPQLLEKVPQIIMTIITGLVGALPKLIEAAPKIIVSIITGIINALPQLITMAPKIIAAVITGLVGALPQLLAMGPKMLSEIWDGLKAQDWGKIGGDIIKGICDGFSTAWSWVEKAVKKVGEKIVGGLKDFFGIHSPSTLMRDEVGQYIGLGISEGIQNTDFMAGIPSMVARAKSSINAAMSGITGNINVTASSAQTGRAQGGDTIIINSPKALSPAETARQVRNAKRQLLLGARS
ncbi:phage tail protein [Caproiciproducens sp.]